MSLEAARVVEEQSCQVNILTRNLALCVAGRSAQMGLSQYLSRLHRLKLLVNGAAILHRAGFAILRAGTDITLVSREEKGRQDNEDQ